MGLPKSPSQLHKRRGTTVLTIALPGFSDPLCNSWSQAGHTKKAETSTAHVHNTLCRWYLFKAPEELKQYIPLSTVLHFGSSVPWQGDVTIRDPPAFRHHHLHHQVHASCNDKGRLHKPGSDQGSAQDSSLLLYWDGVTSFPSPLVSGTSRSWKPSWERAKAQPISSTSQNRVLEDKKWRSEGSLVCIEAS